MTDLDQARRLQKVYRRWAPVYDALFGRAFRAARRRSIAGLGLTDADRVLLIGVGTGVDLPLLPRVRSVAAVDLTREMLVRAGRARDANHAHMLLADAQSWPVRRRTFDAAMLHLILAVAPDGRQVLAEVCRTLVPGGRIAVFDKFASGGGGSPLRCAVNALTRFAGTDITRNLEEMRAGLPLRQMRSEPVLRRAYRIVLLEVAS